MGNKTIGLAAATLLTLYAAPVLSQTVVNPRTVEFDPSADHSAVSTDGVPLVQRYDLSIYTVGGATAQYTANLGRPAPAADGKIRVDFASLLPLWPLPNGTYEARVAALGPGGAGQSDTSNQFSFQGCTSIVSPLNLSLGTAGGTLSVAVSTDPACTWSTATGVSWIAVSPPSGTGPGTVTLTVSANGTPALRAGTLAIAGQIVTVTQETSACAYSLGSNAQTLVAAGGSGTVSVTTLTGCAWTAASGASWLTVAPSNGTGSGAVTFTAGANPTTAARTTALVIGGQTFTVTQSAGDCTFALGSQSLKIGYAGATSSVSVSCSDGCAWSATSNAAWVTVSPGNGQGAGSVKVVVAANDSPTVRIATVTIAGQALTVTQDGKPRPNTPKGLHIVPKPKK